MNENVERYNFYGDCDRATEDDGDYVDFYVLEKERQEHQKTKKRLEKLEDLLYFRILISMGNHNSDELADGFPSKYYSDLDSDETNRLMKLEAQAIDNSQERNNQ